MTPTHWKKTLLASPEVRSGSVLIVLGLAAFAAGIHGDLAAALAPFGTGLILSEIASLGIQQTRQRVKLRARRDE